MDNLAAEKIDENSPTFMMADYMRSLGLVSIDKDAVIYFVRSRYPDAKIVEGKEFIVTSPLLGTRISDFCETEIEAWLSAKQKIKNKGI